MSVKQIAGFLSVAFIMSGCDRGPQDFDDLGYQEQNAYRVCVNGKRVEAEKSANEAVATLVAHSNLAYVEVDKLNRATSDAILQELEIIRQIRQDEAAPRLGIVNAYLTAVNNGFVSCAIAANIRPETLPKGYQPLPLKVR